MFVSAVSNLVTLPLAYLLSWVQSSFALPPVKSRALAKYEAGGGLGETTRAFNNKVAPQPIPSSPVYEGGVELEKTRRDESSGARQTPRASTTQAPVTLSTAQDVPMGSLPTASAVEVKEWGALAATLPASTTDTAEGREATAASTPAPVGATPAETTLSTENGASAAQGKEKVTVAPAESGMPPSAEEVKASPPVLSSSVTAPPPDARDDLNKPQNGASPADVKATLAVAPAEFGTSSAAEEVKASPVVLSSSATAPPADARDDPNKPQNGAAPADDQAKLAVAPAESGTSSSAEEVKARPLVLTSTATAPPGIATPPPDASSMVRPASAGATIRQAPAVHGLPNGDPPQAAPPTSSPGTGPDATSLPTPTPAVTSLAEDRPQETGSSALPSSSTVDTNPPMTQMEVPASTSQVTPAPTAGQPPASAPGEVAPNVPEAVEGPPDGSIPSPSLGTADPPSPKRRSLKRKSAGESVPPPNAGGGPPSPSPSTVATLSSTTGPDGEKRTPRVDGRGATQAPTISTGPSTSTVIPGGGRSPKRGAPRRSPSARLKRSQSMLKRMGTSFRRSPDEQIRQAKERKRFAE